VKVHADWVNLDGAATVQHVSRAGGVFQLGLKLKKPLPPGVLEKLVTAKREAGES
jgi:hypothetical protein